MIVTYIIAAIVCFSIMFCLVIDTSGWWIRAFSDGSNMGTFVSKTNIYTYSGRLFSFTYMSFLSFYIESGANTFEVSKIIFVSLVGGAAAHGILLNRYDYSQNFLKFIAKTIKLDIGRNKLSQQPLDYGWKIKYAAASATAIFCLGMSAPYILASMFPNFRLTLSSVGQILNAVGMLFILLLVDQLLYKSWDRGELAAAVSYYNTGRIMGVIVAAMFVFVIMCLEY